MKIKWNKLAIQQLLDAIAYLEENKLSVYGKKIEKQIFSKIIAVSLAEQAGEPDVLKIGNDGSFYMLIVDRYRIAYRMTSKTLRVLRLSVVEDSSGTNE
jgi:mRNA-degrading endonuclease RelE of RelBE toxin-antitoxin system